MFSMILMASAAMMSPAAVARNNAGAAQLDRMIDQMETLQEDADAVGNTARTRPVVRRAPRKPLKMTFDRNGPRVL